MKARISHRWDLTPAQAAALQSRLSESIVLEAGGPGPETVAGADVAFDRERGRGFAAVIVHALADLREIGRATAEGPVAFPYLPGLLAFREGPLLLEAFARLASEPDLLLFDAHGIAHPRRFGLASHLSLLLDKPGIGVAKSRLLGDCREPAQRAGAWTLLESGGETVGAALRTRAGVKPVYVSVGHRLELQSAVSLVLACCDGYRIPKPIRGAHHLAGRLRRGEGAGPGGL